MNLDRAKENLTYAGDAIAHVMDPNHAAETLLVAELKSSEISTSLHMTLGGQSAFAKVFAENEKAEAAFDRERHALEGLSGLNIPKLLLVAKKQRLLVTSFVPGKPLSETLNRTNLPRTAEFVGQWLGTMSNIVPSHASDDTWADYLAKLDGALNQDILGLENRKFGDVAIGRTLLARNDNALGNFIIGTDKKLYAVDFEACRMKPEGWDLITAARAFAGRFPAEIPAITSALFRGYKLTARNTGLVETFDGLMNILVVALVTGNSSDLPHN